MTPGSLIHADDPIWEVLLRLVINLAVLFVIIRLIYNRYSDKKGYLFSFFLMGIIIFLVCVVLKSVELSMGMAFGLFAVFSIIRFRTRNIAIKEMSYLFTVVGISAINALINYPHPVRGTIIVNVLVIASVFILEISFRKDAEKKDKKEKDKSKETIDESMVRFTVLYANLELLGQAKQLDLIEDLTRKTGIPIEKTQIRTIDLTKGIAELDIYYRPEKTELTVSN